MTVRFKFVKLGPVIYLGHLDVMRYFQKVIRRSGIKASYTEGFSPHLKLSFAQPLSVGVETLGDYFDLEFDELPDMKNLVSLLNAQCVEGLTVSEATLLNEGVLNGMSSVKASKYEYVYENLSDTDIKTIHDFFSQNEYVFSYVRKETQKTRDVIKDVFDYEIKGNLLYATVDSSSAGNMKADILTEALEKFGLKAKFVSYKRIDLYTTDLNEKLIPLGDLGEKYD